MTTYEDKLDILLSEISEIKIELAEIKATNIKMDNHINFIESVFEIVRYPLFGLLDIIRPYVSNQPHKLHNDASDHILQTTTSFDQP
jgi:hypothetical protein